MLSVADYHGDWKLQLHDSYPATARWRVVVPEQPNIADLARAQDCLMQQQLGDFQWLCASKTGLWMLQHHQQQWWLTFWSAAPPALSRHWLGTIISHHYTELYELSLIESNYSAKQLFDYGKFKWGQRRPLLREIAHGQYHLQLQQPMEELFILQLSHASLLLRFRSRAPTAGAGEF